MSTNISKQSYPVTAIGFLGKPRSNANAGMLTVISRGEIYLTSNSGKFDVIADSPEVKTSLARLQKGLYLAQFEGQPYPRATDEAPAFRVTKLAIKQPLQNVGGGLTQPNGPGTPYVLRNPDGVWDLKPMTEQAARLLKAQAETGHATVAGAKRGDTFEVWEVTFPIMHFDRIG
ncbi:MAG: hypothetical protein H6729_08765 [Deltaproteobacteria bacterium]|nr:hypothetical protein [Deltaproteobacteria bacterium]